jgi:hypothetical protein
MSSSPIRSPRARGARLSSGRLGVNASCLLLTILAANHAAARSDTSLPYLAMTGPEPLRFAVRRPLGPLPVRPGALSEKTSEDPESAPTTEKSSDAHSPANPAGTPANVVSRPTTTAQPVVQPVTTPPPSGAALVPDTYAPPPAPITIEDLLPFFIPPAAQPSRATYELK